MIDFIATYYYAALSPQLVSKFNREPNFATVNINRVVLCCLMLFAASSSIAASLGRHRGAALIGKPLDIAVQATLDEQEDLAGLCLDADVFYGDSKVDRARVRVVADPVGQGSRETLVHVRASALVNEPVVSIQLRVGCRQKFEKRYVLLADLVSDAGNQLAALPTVPAAPVAAVSPPIQRAGAVAAGSRQLAAGEGSRPRSPRTSARGIDNKVPAAEVTGATATETPNATSAGSGGALVAGKPSKLLSAPNGPRQKAATTSGRIGSRLKLDLLDLSVERDPQLKLSPKLLSVPAVSEKERSVAAALWRALSAQPEDMLKNMDKLQALELTVKGLQAQNQQSQQAIDKLTTNLKQAQAQRYANFLVFGLLALLLLALLFAAYLWRQRSLMTQSYDEQLPWWRKSKAKDKGWAGVAGDSDIGIGGNGTLTRKTRSGKSGKSSPAEPDVDLGLGSENSDFAVISSNSRVRSRNSVMPLASRDRSDFGMSMTHISRAVKAEELFDVQQQADFFVSLGQHEQAIEVLRNHISDIGQTSAMVYLDLFNLYHQLGRHAEYEALRVDFNERFNARIPSFEQYTIGSLGLEAYSEALQRIVALWPSRKVLEIIEESIFRGADANAEAFDLEAYRELLLLYAIAKDVTEDRSSNSDAFAARFDLPNSGDDESEAKASRFLPTATQPRSTFAGDLRSAEPASDAVPATPRASPRLGLDVDLNDLEVADPAAAEKIESNTAFFEQSGKEESPKSRLPHQHNRLLRAPKVGLDNLIDFDDFTSSVNFDEDSKKPKI